MTEDERQWHKAHRLVQGFGQWWVVNNQDDTEFRAIHEFAADELSDYLNSLEAEAVKASRWREALEWALPFVPLPRLPTEAFTAKLNEARAALADEGEVKHGG